LNGNSAISSVTPSPTRGALIATSCLAIVRSVGHTSESSPRGLAITPTNTSAASVSETAVATAMPITESSGTGPIPNASATVPTMLSAFAAPLTYIGVRVSPVPWIEREAISVTW
jgi:hypothetical protein